MSKIVKFLYRKKINKINKKYFSGLKTGENFKKFKSYRLVIYKKARVTNAWQLDFTQAHPGTAKSKPEEKNKVGAT